MAGVVTGTESWFDTWPCSLDLERVLAGRSRRRLCGRLECLECGRLGLVVEVGAVIAVLENPHLTHDSIVVTFHGLASDLSPEEVGDVVPVVERAFASLHERYASFRVWWVIEQSEGGLVNVHALTTGWRSPRADRTREAFAEASDLGHRPAISSEPVRHPTRIAAYAAKVALFSLITTDARDTRDVLDFALASNAGRFAHHTPGFFGGSEEPWTPQQVRRRGIHRAPRVLRWVATYPRYHEKLPPRLVERLRDPPGALHWRRGTAGAESEEFVLDEETMRYLLEGLDL